MNFQKILWPVLGVGLVVMAYRTYGWAGVAVVVSGIVMWMLLHFTRMMRVLRGAANRPVGYCASAVMFNARLQPGMTLLNVVQMVGALGEQLGEKDAQPEVYRWIDGSASAVTGEFVDGKLVRWKLDRPEAPAGDPAAPAP